jgi:hypothetical protein
MLLGVPLALGSWWGLFTIVPITLVIVWRLLAEEKFLAKNLSGYSEYRNKVSYRLVPFIWQSSPFYNVCSRESPRSGFRCARTLITEMLVKTGWGNAGVH